ncbi:hypothetical protein [Flavobacterium anhuiense]|uniref:hypothetical protein n=1 Tax=Flavobacterium anhuiense TaxID=459526 RepID=UPI0034D9624E
MFSALSFEDFITEEKYLALQNRFDSYNIPPRNVYDEYSIKKIYQEDFSINYLYPAYPKKDYYKTVFFYRDFLNPKIDNLGKDTVDKIKEKIQSEFRYNKLERDSFLEITINDFLLLTASIDQIDYLPALIKEKLKTQCELTVKYLKDYNFESTNNIAEKFKAKLNKTDLLLLLHLLRNKGLLSHPIDSQFGHLIEENFQYFDDKTNSFLDIKNANKTINEIKNYNRPVEKSIKRLRELFQNESFFEL